MSRFFAESDSESSASDSGSESGDGPELVAPTRFEFDSSSDDEEKRVVRSFKDKRYDQMLETIHRIRNHFKINDWVSIQKDWDLLNKQLDSARAVVQREGVPKFYYKIFLEIEEAQKETKPKMKKKEIKMSAPNAKALNTVGQRLKKKRREIETEIETYLQDPLGDGADAEDVEDAEEDDMSAEQVEESEDDKDDFGGPTFDDDDFDDMGDGSDDESSSSGSDIDFTTNIGRDFWVKKDTREDDDRKRKEKKERRKKRAEEAAQRKEEKADNRDKDKREKKREIEYTPEFVIKKLKELISMFGRRSTDKANMILDLRTLEEKAKDPAALLKVKTTLVSALFDRTPSTADYMPTDVWKSCYDCLQDIIKFLADHPKVRLSEDENVEETFEDEDEDADEEAQRRSQEEEKKRQAEEEKANQGLQEKDRVQYVLGNLYSFISRLNSEHTKGLQHIDPHTPEYIERLEEENRLVELMARAQAYYDQIGKIEFQARITLLRLELQYYRYRPHLDHLNTEAKAENAQDGNLIPSLAKFLYKNGDDRSRIRALLCHVYYLALHNCYLEARDLLLMSHVQDTIGNADIRTQILFNRAMAQLGLCAFRNGEVTKSMWCLMELYQTNKVKELLAQGTSNQRWSDRDPEKERLEKMRQYPFHMHMNLDMLESVHLLAAMCLEVVNIATSASSRRRPVNKTFRRLYDHNSRQAFNGPPENTRENIMAATRALQAGEWKKAVEHVLRLKMWSLMPKPVAAHVQGVFMQKLKEVAIKTYVVTYGSQYSSISLQTLVDDFEMPEKTVYRLISTMIVNDQLQGAWDQPNKCIIMHCTDPTRLQRAAIRYSDKIATFVDLNERLLDRGGYHNKDKGDWKEFSRGGGRGKPRGGAGARSSSRGRSYSRSRSRGRGRQGGYNR